jgi:hypothetical protein
MSVIRPKFMQVQPDDLRHGYDGACILALVRFVTDRDDVHNGRVRVDGETWWHTSQRDIAQSLDGHVSHDSVRRTLNNLEAVGALRSRYVSADDRAKAYRVSDLSVRENASTVTSDDAKSPDPDANSRQVNGAAHDFQTSSDLSVRENASTVTSDDAKSPDPDANSPDPDAISPHPRREFASCSSSVEELKKNLEKGENGAEVLHARAASDHAGDPAPPEPNLFCDDHMPDGPGKTKCGPCGDQRRKHKRWDKAEAERKFNKAMQSFDEKAQRNGTPEPPRQHPDAARVYFVVDTYSRKNGPQSRAYMRRACDGDSEDREVFDVSWPIWERAGLVTDVGNGKWTTQRNRP